MDLGTINLPVLGEIALLTVIIWAAVGFIGGLLFSGRGFLGLILGIIGGLLGGAAFTYFGVDLGAMIPLPEDFATYAGELNAVITSLIGAIVLSIIARIILPRH